MIDITGDTHIPVDIQKLSTKRFPEQKEMTKNDYVIICGDFCDSIAHKVDDGIYHLIRGEVYNIDGKKFFVFGGASSHDKEHRTEGKNWWKDEMPSEQEFSNAEENLKKNNSEFDYVIIYSR